MQKKSIPQVVMNEKQNITKAQHTASIHNIMSLSHFIQPVLFTALNLLLLKLHGSTVPTRDLWMCGFGLIGVIVSMAAKRENVALEKTKRFRVLFTSLTMAEVFFTLILPWFFIYVDSENGFALAQHCLSFNRKLHSRDSFSFKIPMPSSWLDTQS